MSKVELQAKVDSMDQEIKFFKCLYEAVSLSLHSTPLNATIRVRLYSETPRRDTQAPGLIYSSPFQP